MPQSLKVLPPEEENAPWYKDGLRFECTGCGKCCTGAPGYIWVTETEIVAIAKFLKLDLEAFMHAYVIEIDGRLSLRDDPISYDCAFLKNKKCQIYSVRPKQCRTYPWWPRHLKSKEDWLEAAKECEGISQDAPHVSCETIREQLAIQEGTSDITIHN